MLKQNNMELKKQIDINNLQKVRVVSGNRKGKVGVVIGYHSIDDEFKVEFGDTWRWYKEHQLEVIEEEKELTVREVVEWLKNREEYKNNKSVTLQIFDDYAIDLIDGDFIPFEITDAEDVNTLQQLTDLIRNKPTESELIEQFKELSMEEKIKLMKNK